ncbi:hypothetical protein LTR56_025439 [Elasticomyces elasticus]|nr:hypothetical protein LTR56_025439 [Elasticomyces elasticus]KAK3652009.1 hypothetical protein LTR22_011939 [Elasticomyces elasticus]KAK5738988.1 hypothetical protein LTS12_025422 [Elasticomyces elasticus]
MPAYGKRKKVEQESSSDESTSWIDSFWDKLVSQRSQMLLETGSHSILLEGSPTRTRRQALITKVQPLHSIQYERQFDPTRAVNHFQRLYDRMISSLRPAAIALSHQR